MSDGEGYTTRMKARYLSLAPLISWQTMSRPISWSDQFGREAPLIVEIGFGNGEFLVRQAQTQLAYNFVGIEVAWASVQRGLRKIAQANLTNVRLLQADARIALERLFRPQSLYRTYTLFPCPWPKERHAKHRLFSQTFLNLLNSRLRTDGTAELVTDYRPYIVWVLGQVPETGFEAYCEPVPGHFSTKYERKWQGQGQEEFYHLRLYKRQERLVPLTEDIPLQTHRIATFASDQFRPTDERGAITVKFRDFLYDTARRRGMVWVFAIEDGLTQDFWIEIAHGKDNQWHIRPARGCSVIPTASVQRALDLVRDASA